MSPEQNDLIPAKGTAKRKRGGYELGSLMLRQRSAKRHEALA
jgi:hypothetical protein